MKPPADNVDYTFDDWLRGYVRTVPVEVRAADRPATSGKHYSASIVYHKKLAVEILGPARGDRIVDLGCATGAITVYCAMLGADCVGVDLSLKALKVCAEYFERNKPGDRSHASLAMADAGVLPFPDNSFDKAVSCDLYEHLDPQTKLRVLKEARRVLRPGGFLVLKTPNLAYLHLSLAFKRLRAISRLENPFKLVVPHTPAADGAAAEHIGLATPFGIERDLRDAGFFDYQFHYGLSTKLRGLPQGLNRLLHRETPVLRDLMVEEVIVKATKSHLVELIPD